MNFDYPYIRQFKVSMNKHLIAFSILVASFVVTFFNVWQRLISTWWTQDDYSHGFLIVPICIFIIFGKLKKMSGIQVKTSWLGFAFFIISTLLYLIAEFAEIYTLSSLSMALVIASTVGFLFGWNILKEVSFPIFLLLFMIPIPAQIYSLITISLQLFVSKIGTELGRMAGIPILLEGNVIYLPDMTLQIVEACSGIRSMVSLLFLGSVLGYFTLRLFFNRVLLILSSIPAAILVNIIRVFVLTISYHYFQYDLTQGTLHTVFGVFIFLLALLIVFLMSKVLYIWDR